VIVFVIMPYQQRRSIRQKAIHIESHRFPIPHAGNGGTGRGILAVDLHQGIDSRDRHCTATHRVVARTARFYNGPHGYRKAIYRRIAVGDGHGGRVAHQRAGAGCPVPV